MHETIPLGFCESVCRSLAQDKRVSRRLPGGGRLYIDRPLPFLFIQRDSSPHRPTSMAYMVSGEASYLAVQGNGATRKNLDLLVTRIVETLAPRFGAFLLVEIWTSSLTEEQQEGPDVPLTLAPSFAIAATTGETLQRTINTLVHVLGRMEIQKQVASVEVNYGWAGSPPGMPRLVSVRKARRNGCHLLGIQVRPIYEDPNTKEIFPRILRHLRRSLSKALKQGAFRFSREHTSLHPVHYYVLGRRAMVKTVWEIDRKLADISESFDFLLHATPINSHQAWLDFKRSRFTRAPSFHYRPIAIDPATLKRRLYSIPIHRVDDPTLAFLFMEKQHELDRRLTLLSDIGTSRFLYGALQIYGPVEPRLLAAAEEILAALPGYRPKRVPEKNADAERFAAYARQEIARYREIYPGFTARVSIRDDMYSGLMASHGHLFIGQRLELPEHRIEPLIHHEVGTHLLTFYNGHIQPFRQLRVGLAGYEELQEGLAVLAEHLVDGLSMGRLRLLAGRVIAAHRVVENASFVDVFHELQRGHGFPPAAAYTIAMRVFRGGGITKDAIYLRGLVSILSYLQRGGDLEPLFIGKIAAEHIPLVRELRMRRILLDPPLRPLYMQGASCEDKLRRIRAGCSVVQLVTGETR